MNSGNLEYTVRSRVENRLHPESPLLKRIYGLRGVLMLPPFLFMCLCCKWEVENAWVVFGLGGILMSAGLLLRIWAQMHLRYRLRVRKTLTTTGPYAHVRNPVYIANTILLLSACFMSELLWFAPVALAWCAVVYQCAVLYEQSHLANKYGDAYREYKRRVPRWLPCFVRTGGVQVCVVYFLWPSVLAEAHNLVFLIPFVLKEFLK